MTSKPMRIKQRDRLNNKLIKNIRLTSPSINK